MEKLNNYKKNAETDYKSTPISVLKYITALEIMAWHTMPTKPASRYQFLKQLTPRKIAKILIVAMILALGVMALISEI